LQRQDPELSDIMARLRGEQVQGYVLSQGTLFWEARNHRDRKLVVPTAARDMVFSYFHDSPLGGHLGVRKTIAKIREKFSWPGIKADIRARVRACHTCALSKPAQHTKWVLLASEVAERPM
jgi:hypothetical protein